MRILIYGSTYLTELVCKYLIKFSKYELVGYIPNKKRITVQGKMPIEKYQNKKKYNIALSIQYDSLISETVPTFNVHTGLLPKYGGVDILYHTLKNKEKEQGITFHLITEKIDFGPIISKITYPVFVDDKIEDLYKRIIEICPSFTLLSLKLVENIGLNRVGECYSEFPNIYKSGMIEKADMDEYIKTKKILKNLKKNSNGA